MSEKYNLSLIDQPLDTLIDTIYDNKVYNDDSFEIIEGDSSKYYTKTISVYPDVEVKGEIISDKISASSNVTFNKKIIAKTITLSSKNNIDKGALCVTFSSNWDLTFRGDLICYKATVSEDSSFYGTVVTTKGSFNRVTFHGKVFAGENVDFNHCQFLDECIILPEDEVLKLSSLHK